MCGICGFVSPNSININDLVYMNDTMFHRGPDDSGAEIYEASDGTNIGLAQRRLSILDLSNAGHQPMHSKDKRISIVFNGEIYNFKELKKELFDYPYSSECDTEVIIAAYLKWGIFCVNRFVGMFAIAIYDRKINGLYLIRDNIGKKPLYYYHLNGELVFSSELKGIMAYPGFEKSIKKEIIPRFLVNQYINAPDTIYNNVFKLEPGSILFYKNGNIEITKYWSISDSYNHEIDYIDTNYESVKSELDNKIRNAVKRRMISDVPLGSFLSGGIDSSLITAIAQMYSQEPLKTFCIGFEDERYNEAPYARKISDYLGTNHTDIYLGEKEMFDQIESIPKYFDEPFADPSEIPTMLVSSLAKTKVTVVLSGDGGDELFCGYNVYDYVKKAMQFDATGELLYKIIKLGHNNVLSDKIPKSIMSVISNRRIETKTQFVNYYYNLVAEKMMIPGVYQNGDYLIENQYQTNNWQIKRMLLDMDTYLPGDILCKVDRASMKYSLETRCPLLDKDIIEYSFRIPHSFKYNNNDKKHILKDIAFDYIPEPLLKRSKHGFSVPIDKWLKGPLKDKLLHYSNNEFLRKQGLFSPEIVGRTVSKYLENEKTKKGEKLSKIIWPFFIFQEWFDYYEK